MYLQQLADFRFDQPGGYALRPDRGGAAYGPPATPLTTLAEARGPAAASHRPLLAQAARASCAPSTIARSWWSSSAAVRSARLGPPGARCSPVVGRTAYGEVGVELVVCSG